MDLDAAGLAVGLRHRTLRRHLATGVRSGMCAKTSAAGLLGSPALWGPGLLARAMRSEASCGSADGAQSAT